MKKLYLIFSIFFLLNFSYSQIQLDYKLSHQKNNNLKEQIKPENRGVRSYQDTVPGMYWDFNGALPPNWTVVDNTGNNYVWVWSDVGPHGAYTHPTGQPWYVNIAPLASTTSTNGFLLFQADNYNTDQTTGDILPGYIDHDSYIQTQALDLSGVSSVILRFQESFRLCCTYNNADLYVSVSNDSINWTDFKVASTYATIGFGIPSPMVENVALNISSVAANQSSVYIRFHIRGLSHYYWMVDDVAITEGPHYDLAIEEYYPSFFTYHSGTYTMIPQAQSINGYIGWNANVVNLGGEDLHNVFLEVEVLWNGLISYIGNSNIETPITNLPALSVTNPDSLTHDSIFFLGDDLYPSSQGLDTSYLAACPGIYELTWTATMDETDENWSNNYVLTSFIVNDSVYARDNGIPQGSVSSQKWALHGDDGDIFGVTYEIINQTWINSVANSMSIYINPSTSIDTTAPTIKGVLYMFDGINSWNPFLETDMHTITAADTSKWIILPFLLDGFSEYLVPGDYLAAIEVVTYNNGDLDIGEDLVTEQVSWTTMWKFAGDSSFVWLSNYSSTPLIRLNFIPWEDLSGVCCWCNIGVNSVSCSNIELKVFPNPTAGKITIQAEGVESVEVFDLRGLKAKSQKTNIKGQKCELDLSQQPKGIYIIKVTTDRGVAVEKLIKN